MKAIWNGEILAESNNTKVIESNHFFPPESLNCQHFQQSKTRSTSSQRGKANYFNIQIGEAINPDAALFYPHPKEEAASIKNYVTFSNGVEITE